MSNQVSGGAATLGVAPKPTPVLAVAIPLGLAAMIATIALSINAGAASFVIPTALGASFILIIRRKLALLGMTQESTAVTVGIALGVSALFAVAGLQVAAKQRAQDEAIQSIVALGKTDPAAQRVRLAGLDDEMLTALGKIVPALANQERARRAAEIERQKGEQLAAARKANAAKITALLIEVAALPAGDVDGRLAVYRQLTELDPANGEYGQKVAELTAKQERQRTVRDHPERGLELVNYSWSKSGFGSVMLLNATVRNVSEVAIKDFRIFCEHSADSGTVIDSNTQVAYERLEPGQTKRLRNFNMGFIANQSARSSCMITNAKVAE